MPRKRRTSQSTKAIAHKALKLAREVKANQEIKFLDTVVSDANVNFLGSASIELNNAPQGIRDTERIGDVLRCLSYRMRFVAERDNSSAAAVRCIIIWDKRNTISGIGDILTQTGNVESYLADYFHDKRRDYTVMFDKTLNCSSDWRSKTTGSWRKKINKKVVFAEATINIEQGVMKIFMISDVSNGAVNQPNFKAYIRVFYADS